MIVGLCGLARSGKDSFFRISKKILEKNGVKCYRYAFADELKKDMVDFLEEKFNINPFTEDPEEKNLIRPLLVSYGMAKRNASEGRYWIEKIKNKISSDSRRLKKEYIFITDVRFPNETKFINDLGGFCIYIDREGNNPGNEEEAENDPLIKVECEEIFKWKNFNEENMESIEGRILESIKKYG